MKSLTTKSVYHDKYMLLCFFVMFLGVGVLDSKK